MVLNDAGRTSATCWLQIPDHFPNVELDEWVVMPNHMHGIVVIVGANNYSPLPVDSAIPDDLPLQRPTGTSRTIDRWCAGSKLA